jgi:hypothetical protein
MPPWGTRDDRSAWLRAGPARRSGDDQALRAGRSTRRSRPASPVSTSAARRACGCCGDDRRRARAGVLAGLSAWPTRSPTSATPSAGPGGHAGRPHQPRLRARDRPRRGRHERRDPDRNCERRGDRLDRRRGADRRHQLRRRCRPDRGGDDDPAPTAIPTRKPWRRSPSRASAARSRRARLARWTPRCSSIPSTSAS